MGRLGTFIFGMIAGAGLVFGGQRYHVVNSKEGVVVVPKIEASFSDIYTDIRNFGPNDWNEHRSLAAALMKSGKESVLQDSVEQGVRENLRGAINRLMGDSPTN